MKIISDLVLDLDFLKNLREEAFGPEGMDDFKNLLKTYIQSGEKNLEQIPQALAKNDRAEATRLAHSLKGASASVGAKKIAAASKAMEFTLKGLENPDANLDDLLQKMNSEFAEARLALQKYIQA